MLRTFSFRVSLIVAVATLLALGAWAQPPKLRSSLINLHHPEVDASALYAFRSYEPGREGYVTFIANYNPLQPPGGAPSFYPLDERARYDLHVDNDGDGVEDLTFRFRFRNRSPFLVVPVPLMNPQQLVPIGIANVFPAGPGSPPPGVGGAPPDDQRLNWVRTYSVRVLRGPVSPVDSEGFLKKAGTQAINFDMPFDYIGPRSFPDYDAYAAQFIYEVDVPNCPATGRVFVGQRQESYAFNRGFYFDLVGIPDFLGPRDAFENPLGRYNVTSLALEIPIDCLTEGEGDVIGAWTTGRRQRAAFFIPDPTFEEPEDDRGALVQVTRLGMPFAASPQIGLPDQSRYNTGHPSEDLADFGTYYQFPSIPQGVELVSILNNSFNPAFPLIFAPSNLPRNDLVAVYLQGLPGFNQNGSSGDVLRLNTAIPPTAMAAQDSLGFLAFDNAGFPNGRRPGDDVIDVVSRILEGALCHPPFDLGLGLCAPADAPSGLLPVTDQVLVEATDFDEAFPYLNTPLPGAGN